MLAHSELILNPNLSIYHLKLTPGQLSKDIITVGDPDRVDLIATHLDSIEIKVKSREFYTITGSKKGKRISIISTGIGTDNIDIVFNEIDAIFNIDFESRTIKNDLTKLNFYRIGTSGAIKPNIPLDSFLISKNALGFDGLIPFYNQNLTKKTDQLSNSIPEITNYNYYLEKVSDALITKFNKTEFIIGNTITAAGFYNPQGRSLRLKNNFRPIINKLSMLTIDDICFTNIEMETAGIYGLSNLLGHNAISLNAILANRANGVFSKKPKKTINKLIELTLDTII